MYFGRGGGGKGEVVSCPPRPNQKNWFCISLLDYCGNWPPKTLF
jgi:hypothetical protein